MSTGIPGMKDTPQFDIPVERRKFPERCSTGHGVHYPNCKHCQIREHVRWDATGYLIEEREGRDRLMRSVGEIPKLSPYLRGPMGEEQM
jgi:hypothetical protein